MGLPDPLLLGTAPAPVAENHARNAPLAALLALVCPGLGHFYCGATGASLLWSLAPHVGLLAMLLAGVFNAPNLHLWLAAGLLVWLALRLAQVGVVWKRARGLGQYTLKPTNNAALYVAFFLGTSIFNSLISVPFRDHVLEPFKVPSSSMEPSLTAGDQFFVVKLGPYSQVRRGDVVVFHRPSSDPLVKRVVALGGDTIETRDRVLVLNGAEQPLTACAAPQLDVEETMFDCFVEGAHRVLHPTNGPTATTLAPTEVPKGRLFVMGDSREKSVDSREFGPIVSEDVIGRVAVVWISFGAGSTLRTERIGVQP